MWAVENQTPFKAERTFVRDVDGSEIWLVAVRATYRFDSSGVVSLADKQQDVCLAPKFFGDPAKTSLQYESDLVRTKSGTDILLHAAAHAPQGRPVPTVDVSWQVGPVTKQLRVYGDRVWEHGMIGLQPGQPQPFRSLPIRYERALGGAYDPGKSSALDPSNPAGIGRIPVAGQPVPNCEDPRTPIRSPGDKSAAAGFGPLACHWAPRVALAGTYDDAWRNARQPLLPADFKDAYFRAAPADQQMQGFLQGGEEVYLRNLSPNGDQRFRLPRIRLGFRTAIDGGVVHHRGDLHTVIVEPDESRLIMVWHTSLPCHHTLYTLKRTVVYEKTILESQADAA
jgi:hypothetical protein